MSAFLLSAKRMAKKPYSTKPLAINAQDLSVIAKHALALSSDTLGNNQKCREFFETWFEPVSFYNKHNQEFGGFVTGYFEPEIKASTIKSDEFSIPAYSRPPDLIEFTSQDRPDCLPEGFYFARRHNGKWVTYPNRKAIETGALSKNGLDEQELTLFWCQSRIDLFFVQIQGSARVKLEDGTQLRISYNGKSGHPFTPIGKRLIDRGLIEKNNVSMQTIRAWLEQNPDQADHVMRENQSYIFFKKIDHPQPELGPVAAGGVPLLATRSLAIDHRLHTFGTPIYVETSTPLPGTSNNFRQLMIAQDTGSAIVGPQRGDLFMGSGYKAGINAGAIKNKARFTLLRPRKSYFGVK